MLRSRPREWINAIRGARGPGAGCALNASMQPSDVLNVPLPTIAPPRCPVHAIPIGAGVTVSLAGGRCERRRGPYGRIGTGDAGRFRNGEVTERSKVRAWKARVW